MVSLSPDPLPLTPLPGTLLVKSGGPGGSRTHSLLLARELLSHLATSPRILSWYRRRGLEPPTSPIGSGCSALELRRSGTASGIRTRVFLIESQVSYPLEDGRVAGDQGLEPRSAGSKPAVFTFRRVPCGGRRGNRTPEPIFQAYCFRDGFLDQPDTFRLRQIWLPARESNSHLLGQSQAYSRWTNRQLVPRAGIEPASRCSSSSRSTSELPRSTNGGVETPRWGVLPSARFAPTFRHAVTFVAERAGFEPARPFRAHRISNPAPWTTRPPLRVAFFLASSSSTGED